MGLGIFSTELPCGRSWGHGGGILDYQTLVSASEEGDRIAVVSLRGPGYLPPVERALLCTEPRPAAGSAQASWKISFSSGPGPLYVMNADGSGQRWLTLTLTSWGTSAWSPDGRRIAFGSDRDGNGEVYVMNADGSGQRNLTRKPEPRLRSCLVPRWAEDRLPEQPRRQLRDLRHERRREPAAEPHPQPGKRERLCVVARRAKDRLHERARRQLGGLRHDRRRERAAEADARQRVGVRPVWSPDGRKIAFMSQRDGNSEVYVMNADGSGQRNLTRSPRYEGGPAWSPDGRKIAFASGSRSCRAGEGCAGNTDVYVMNADGSGQRRLTRAPRDDFVPAWSPDGRKIAFVSKRDGNPEIYVMNTDGSEQRNLTRSPADDGLVRLVARADEIADARHGEPSQA